jgi:DNA-binding transcriptional ArsR family regulator
MCGLLLAKCIGFLFAASEQKPNNIYTHLASTRTMGKCFLALFLALFVAFAQAGWVAQIYGTYSSLDYTKLANISAATALTNSTLEYPGHYGKYVVSVTKTPLTISVLASGDEESVYSLTMELAWLSSVGAVPSSVCKDYSNYNVSESGYEGCNGKVLMFFCPSCEIAQAVSAASDMTNEPAPQVASGASALPFVQDANKATSPMRTAGDSVSAAEALGAPLSQPKAEGGIFDNITLQLLVAFFAVIVASYLVLQNRTESVQVQRVDPQIERLLSNETRAGIMSELSVADKIPTDLSVRLGKSKAAIVEHLAELITVGLVEKIETPGRKFVYYRLTQKGRQVLLRRAG